MGIWAGYFGGEYKFDLESEMGSEFTTAFGGVTDSPEGSENYPIYFFGAFHGTFDNEDQNAGNVDADASGVWISEQGQQEQFVRVGVIEGQASGNFSAGEGSSGELQLSGVGDWTGVANLQADVINLTQIQDILSSAAISEIGNTLAQGEGSFSEGQGNITGTMNASFYTGLNDLSGIWSALFNGTYSGLPEGGSSWTATFTAPGADLPVTALLTSVDGFNQNGGQWLANVSGTFGENISVFTGQAGGSFTPNVADSTSGIFSGVGVGTWQEAPPGPPCGGECT